MACAGSMERGLAWRGRARSDSRGYDVAGLRPSTALVAETVDGGGERRVGDEAGRQDEEEEELQRSGWRRQAGEGTGRRFGRCGACAQRRRGKGMEAARGRRWDREDGDRALWR